MKTNGHRPRSTGPAYNPGLIYALEFATVLALQSTSTLEEAGERLTAALQNVVRDSSRSHPLVVSRAVFYLLALLKSSYDQPFMRTPVVLHAISSFDEERLEGSALPVITGLVRCIQSQQSLRAEITSSPDFWSILQRLHAHPEAASLVFDVLKDIVTASPSSITADNYESAVSLANDFASAGSVGAMQEQRKVAAARRQGKPRASVPDPPKPLDNPLINRGVQAVDLIHPPLTDRVPSLINQSHLERHEAWAAYWSPIFRALSKQCLNPSRDIRNRAIGALQSSIQSREMESGEHAEWNAIFNDVLFPLMVRLLKPEVYQSDPSGMQDSRVRIARVVCSIFTYYVDNLHELKDPDTEQMQKLWIRVLDIMDRLMNSGQGESLVSLAQVIVISPATSALTYDSANIRSKNYLYDCETPSP